MEMEGLTIKRLENNHYALDKAYERLKAAIEHKNDPEIYAATGELLLWVITTEEWHYKKGNKKLYAKRRDADPDGIMLKGIRHAYNMMKHNMEFVKIHHEQKGMTFPFSFPMSFSPVVWGNGELLDGRYKEQKENYIKYIQGKAVLDTFHQVLKFLEKENSRYIK